MADPHKLPNYIRTHRKQNGFSQEELAFLLSCKNGAKVSRYENFSQHPNLETAIVLEILFHTPIRSLFAGVAEDAEKKLKTRAVKLHKKLLKNAQSPIMARKLLVLEILRGKWRGLPERGN